jgi:Sec-independent protein translocase protein TatA
MGSLGFEEMIAIAIIAILVYGRDLPGAARKLAAFYSKLRRQLNDIKDEIQRQIPAEELSLESKAPSYPVEPTEPPSTPTGLEVNSDHTQAYVTWYAPSNAESYVLRRGTTAGGPRETLVTGLTDCSYSDANLTDGQTYYYVVAAVNKLGESPDSEEVSTTIHAKPYSEEVPQGEPAPAGPVPVAPGGNGSAPVPAAEVPSNGSTHEPAAPAENSAAAPEAAPPAP